MVGWVLEGQGVLFSSCLVSLINFVGRFWQLTGLGHDKWFVLLGMISCGFIPDMLACLVLKTTCGKWNPWP